MTNTARTATPDTSLIATLAACPPDFANPTSRRQSRQDRARVAVVIDTPNIVQSVRQHSHSTRRPDFMAFLKDAANYGSIITARAVMTAKVPRQYQSAIADLGYSLSVCHDLDCDDRVVAEMIRVSRQADVLLLAAGDGHYKALVATLRELGKRVIVATISGCCSRKLTRLANGVMPFPVHSVLQ